MNPVRSIGWSRRALYLSQNIYIDRECRSYVSILFNLLTDGIVKEGGGLWVKQLQRIKLMKYCVFSLPYSKFLFD